MRINPGKLMAIVVVIGNLAGCHKEVGDNALEDIARVQTLAHTMDFSFENPMQSVCVNSNLFLFVQNETNANRRLALLDDCERAITAFELDNTSLFTRFVSLHLLLNVSSEFSWVMYRTVGNTPRLWGFKIKILERIHDEVLLCRDENSFAQLPPADSRLTHENYRPGIVDMCNTAFASSFCGHWAEPVRKHFVTLSSLDQKKWRERVKELTGCDFNTESLDIGMLDTNAVDRKQLRSYDVRPVKQRNLR